MTPATPLLSALLIATASAIAQPVQTVINGKPLTAQQKAEFRRIYGVQPLASDF